jgi:hypothetical protein
MEDKDGDRNQIEGDDEDIDGFSQRSLKVDQVELNRLSKGSPFILLFVWFGSISSGHLRDIALAGK